MRRTFRNRPRRRILRIASGQDGPRPGARDGPPEPARWLEVRSRDERSIEDFSMWHSARRYGLALLLTGAGLAANQFGPPVLHELVFFLLLGAIFVSSWYGGLGPGVLATGLAV